MKGRAGTQPVRAFKMAPTREDVPRLVAPVAWVTTLPEWRRSLLQASGAARGPGDPALGAWYGAFHLARWERLPEPVRTGLIRRFASLRE